MRLGRLMIPLALVAVAPAILLGQQIPTAGSAARHIVVAKPEARTIMRVGDVVILPLYDSKNRSKLYGDGLRTMGVRRIAPHDLWRDAPALKRADFAPSIYDAASDRGEVFLAERVGAGSATILLTLPRFTEHCISCRIVHYFFRVLPKRHLRLTSPSTVKSQS